MANRQRPILLAKIQILGARPNIGGGFLHFRRLFLPLCVQERTGLGKNVGKKWGTTFTDETHNAPMCVRLRQFCPPFSAFSRRSFAFSLMVRPVGQKMDKFGEKTVEFSRKAAVFRAKVHRFWGAVERHEQKGWSMCEKSALRGTKIASDVALSRRGGEERACFCRKREQVAAENLL